MNIEQIAALALATLVLVSIPGPNVALIVGRSLQHGVRAGIVTTFGTTIGVALQLLLVLAGISAAVEAAASVLTILRWLGVLYLFYLAFSHWRRPPSPVDVPEMTPARVDIGRGIGLALMNPKVLIFNAAFLPQFVDADQAVGLQLAILGSVYLGVLFAGDALWALFAASARRWLGKYSIFRNKLSAVFYAGAGIGLALARRAG